MDITDLNGEEEPEQLQPKKPRQLPSDLPKSLDDRRQDIYRPDVEIYDDWSGQAQSFAPSAAKPLDFNLALNDSEDPFETSRAQSAKQDLNARLDRMLQAQAAYKEDARTTEDEEDVAKSEELTEDDKRAVLQKTLNLAASNGDVKRLKNLLHGTAKAFIDINQPDPDGTAPLIYACCFGHADVAEELLKASADVDQKDSSKWTSLMWATANRHRDIVELLLKHGASPEAKSTGGRTAFDFVVPHSELSDYLHENGYKIGSAGVSDDFYNSGLSSDRFEEEMAENEMKRRMMMESAINLEVDLGNLGIDEPPESPGELEEESQDFVWDRCLNDQMFVFQESELAAILDIIITNMQPQRTPSQKPVPANILFLAARYAHYHAGGEHLSSLCEMAMEKLNDVIDRYQWDMAQLAFWMSNLTLLLHYLKKDPGLHRHTTDWQLQIAELINEIFVLVIRDAERRMDKVLDEAMLDHETIPGFEDITFQGDWRIFKSKPKVKAPEPPEKRFRPPSPKRRAKISPRNITSLLSSTLFVLDLYDIHSVIIAQTMNQLMYWLGAELFNRVMSNRKYLARTKAMQIRMNVSVLEEWAKANSRQPEHYENGSTKASGDTTDEAARGHLAPVIQLLQWLQIFTSLGKSDEALQSTIAQLPRLSPQHLVHTLSYYRNEVGEEKLPKDKVKYLRKLQKEWEEDKKRRKSNMTPKFSENGHDQRQPTPSSPEKPYAASDTTSQENGPEEDEAPENLLLDPALMLPFSLPTSTDMIISYGAGFGGMNRERERKYIPTVPPEFLAKLDLSGGKNGKVYEEADWNNE
ncbi:MAG: hypothetical protein Q9159_000963 [Coniocarpon cinnabarinum]